MKFVYTWAFFCVLCISGNAQVISVETDISQRTEPTFIGASTEFMYPIMIGVPNADTTAYDSAYIDCIALQEINRLRNKVLRFPGGTISQYYHFNNQHGYGTIPEDLECRPNFFHLPVMQQKVVVDPYYPDNMIDTYIDLAQDLSSESQVQTLYVMNMMGHFFHGDMIPINPLIDTLIDIYGAPLGAYLDASPKFLTDPLTDLAVDVMEAVYNDPQIVLMQQWLATQPGFAFRVNENLNAVAHLIAENMPVIGIELGNENYAFTMLKDDDLSEYPYDCTTPDSIVQAIGTIPLSTKTYMQAIIKYAIISEIYATIIHANTTIPAAIVINATEFNVTSLSLDSFAITPSTSERSRYLQLWNRFIGRLDFYDAAIPHIYMKSLPSCEVFDNLDADSIAYYSKHYLDFYFTDVIPYQLGTISQQLNGKPLWITEWNINTANAMGNTFLHAGHCFRFMNTLNDIHDDYNIELINYHNIAAWNYNQFSLLRTQLTNDEYKVYRQTMYYPYKIMADLHAEQPYFSTIDFGEWLGPAGVGSEDHYYHAYLCEDKSAILVNFINFSANAVNVPLENVQFEMSESGSPTGTKSPAYVLVQKMEAESLFSSDRGCDTHPQYYDDYEWGMSKYGPFDVQIPSFSLGQLIIKLQ